jgi:phenylacetic acid degradation operon negative regulatory protein
MWRAVLDQQCTHFHGAETDITADAMRALFALDAWAADAHGLIEAMDNELDTSSNERRDTTEHFADQFALSIAVVRHLQLDPVLPVELLSDHWPGTELRSAYRRFDKAFKQKMNAAFRASS